MIKPILLFFLLTLSSFANWNGKILKPSTQTFVSKDDLITQLSLAQIIVVGEKHYTKEVQLTEAAIMSEVIKKNNSNGHFTLSWEFLNKTDEHQTETLFDQVMSETITINEFLLKTQNSEKAYVYAPIIEVVKNLNGKIIGGNLSRAEKAPVLTGGIPALDPILLPPEFELGGKNYLSRFFEVMQGHATPTQINNYFAAQSLVDDSIAYHLKNDSKVDLNFIIIGAFHSQFNDGIIKRINKRSLLQKTLNLEIIDATDYTEDELKNIGTHEIYGPRADYLIFIKEPIKL